MNVGSKLKTTSYSLLLEKKYKKQNTNKIVLKQLKTISELV